MNIALWVAHTPEGDSMCFCEARFAVGDRAALVHALDLAADIPRSDEGAEEWTWVEPVGASDRILGRMTLDGDTLRVEASSRERMTRAKTLLAKLAAGELRHLETTERSVEEVRAERENSAQPEPREEVPPDVKKELVTKLMDEHYHAWFDMELPALDGWTPRRAVRDPKIRMRVADLLKGIANLEEHKRQRGDLAYDSDWMWKELGFERPGG